MCRFLTYLFLLKRVESHHYNLLFHWPTVLETSQNKGSISVDQGSNNLVSYKQKFIPCVEFPSIKHTTLKPTGENILVGCAIFIYLIFLHLWGLGSMFSNWTEMNMSLRHSSYMCRKEMYHVKTSKTKHLCSRHKYTLIRWQDTACTFKSRSKAIKWITKAKL